MPLAVVRAATCAFFLTAQIAIAAPACRPISGFDQYLARAHGVFVADMHGTVEAPAFMGALICNFWHSGRAVVLALEYPSEQQHFLEEFLRARADNRQPALLSTPFWTRPRQDGRTSHAMLDLLFSVREQVRHGARVRVVAFDTSVPMDAVSGSAAFNARDEAMAKRLRQELASIGADEIPLIFTGNVHARKIKGLQALNAPPGMESAEPLGYRLGDLGFLHMNIEFRGGSAWICASTCGVHKLGEPGPAVGSSTVLPSSDPAYDLEYSPGALTASPPATTAK